MGRGNREVRDEITEQGKNQQKKNEKGKLKERKRK